MNEIVQWLIRNSQGDIEGPFTTVEVVRKIRSGLYFGEEFISRYPSGRWYPISYDQNFFNILLEVLESELFEKPDKPKKEVEEVTQRIEVIKKANVEAQKKEEVQKDLGKAVFEDLDAKTPVIIEMQKEPTKVGRAVVDKSARRKKKKVRKKVKKKGRRSRRGSLQFLILSFSIIIVAVVYLYLQDDSGGTKQIHLRRPNYQTKEKLTKFAANQTMARAIKAFRKDNYRNYLIAQDALVEIVSKSKSLKAYGFLCMTYRELWPFTHQDQRDYKTLELVLQKTQKINPKSDSANICLVVSHWVKGRYDDAQRIMEDSLETNPGMIFFNHMMGDIYAARRDYRSASYYFSKVRELWNPPPVWSKSLLQEARMYRKARVPGQAAKLYRLLLSSNPQHAVAKIELGILELEPFENINKARDYINSSLASGQFIPKPIESEAFETLAKIAILQGNNGQALQYAQNAFSTDSSNEESRELIVKLGGIKALNSVGIDNDNLVYLGEQYMKMKNYSAAQAEFKGAFEANPKNGFAALRAGEALWELGQSNDAIDWVKKSIHADPSFIRSYLILADFQSARFDYENAIETLKGALRVNPRQHGIYRGFALIELRRRNYPGAVRFSKKALELYDTDIDSLIILAKALTKQGNAEEGFTYLQKATELDPSHEQVHVTFAKIRAVLSGTDAGIMYLESKINQNGKIVYRRTIGELLAEEERNEEAIQNYYEALEINPQNKGILMDLAKILQREKRYDEARDLFLEAAAQDPTDAEPLFRIGQLYLDSGKNAEALKQFENVIDVNQNFPLAHFYAGQAHIRMKNTDEALKMAEQERLMNPEIPESYMLAAEAHFINKQYALCTEEYQKVLSKGLKTAEIFIKLARCERARGNFDSAITMLDEAKNRESGNPDIFKEAGFLYLAKGYYEKSIQGFTRYIQLSPNAKDKKAIEAMIDQVKKMGDEQ